MDKIAHDLTLLYLALYDDHEAIDEGTFVGIYVNTNDRILAALPDCPSKSA